MRRAARGMPSFTGAPAPAPASDAVAGTAAGTSSASGTVVNEMVVAGSAAGAATVSGTVVNEGVVAGTAAGTSTASGTVYSGIPSASLSLHFDASSSANTVVSSEVTSLNDRTGGGNDATPASGDNGGELVAAGAPSGRDCISYNGTDESNMVASASGLPDGSDDRTWYWVGRVADNAATNWMFVTGTLSAHQYFVIEMRQGTPDYARFTSGTEVLASDDSFDEWAVWCIKYASGDLTMYKNGTQVASGTPTTLNTTFGDVRLGAIFNGDNKEQLFGELACYSVAHNDTERGGVESILDARWMS